MRSLMNACLFLAAASAVCAPNQARADGYVTPWIGVTLASPIDSGRSAFGVTTGYMGGGVFGFEGDFGYSPDFLGSITDFGNSNAITVMGNFIVGVPIGGTHGAGVRPFLSGGFGLMRTHFEGGAVLNVPRSITEAGYDLGVGMMGFFNQHVGLRGDVRYLRTLQDTNLGRGVDFDLGRLRYWRLSAGLTFR